MTIGEIIRARRVACGYSARQLSLAAGLSESVVGKVESGSIEPSLRVFAALARHLDLSVGEIALLVRMEVCQRDMGRRDGR